MNNWGRSELIADLRGDDATNPFTKWQLELEQGERLEDNLHYAESIKVLEALLLEIEDSRGPGAEHYLALTYGHLARSYLQNGEVDKALPATETALRLCREQNDVEGIVIYLRGPYEVHRYMGNGKVAADYSANWRTPCRPRISSTSRSVRARVLESPALAAGRIEQEDFLVLRTLEDDSEMDAEEKVCLAEQALAERPALALPHLHYGIKSAGGRGGEMKPSLLTAQDSDALKNPKRERNSL